MTDEKVATNNPTEVMDKKPEMEKIKEFIINRKDFLNQEIIKEISKEAFDFLEDEMKNLLVSSLLLNKIFIKPLLEKDLLGIDIFIITNDYSFIAFPAAKALEGYLKKLLVKIRLLKASDLKKDPFKSIGPIINTKEFEKKVINKRFRHVPKEIQAEWDKSRNYISHYDLNNKKISREEAEERIKAILKIIKDSYEAFCVR